MSYFTEDLLNSIKLRSLAPISQATFSDTDLLTLASEEQELKLVSDLVSVREDFFVTYQDTSITSGISRYAIPSRAIGNSLKQLFYVDGNGNEIEISKKDVTDRQYYALTGPVPSMYYFEGDEVVLHPKPNQTIGSLRFYFPAMPNRLIATSSCAKIESITDNNPNWTFNVDTDLTGSITTGDYVDFLSATSPFKLWSYRVPVVSTSSSTIVVLLSNVLDEAGVNVEPQVNDYICPSGFTNIPQIPTAFHPVLAQMVNVRLMESMGDINKLNAAQQTLLELRNNAMKLVKNRVESAPQKMSTRKSLIRYFR